MLVLHQLLVGYLLLLFPLILQGLLTVGALVVSLENSNDGCQFLLIDFYKAPGLSDFLHLAY